MLIDGWRQVRIRHQETITLGSGARSLVSQPIPAMLPELHKQAALSTEILFLLFACSFKP
jgi:hypothetical protein